MIVEHSEAIALVQKSFAERFAKSADICIYEPPISIAPLKVCMYRTSG